MEPDQSGVADDIASLAGSLLVEPAGAETGTEPEGQTTAATEPPERKDDAPAGDAEGGDADGETTGALNEDDGAAKPVEEQKPPAATVRVKKPDGTEADVPVEEVARAYLLHQQADQQLAAIREQRAQEMQAFQLAQQVLAQQVPPAPDLALAFSDPVAYTQQRAAHEAGVQRLQALMGHQEQLHQQAFAEQRAAAEQHLARERDALVQRIPEWKDPAVAKAERGRIIGYGRKLGFSDEELGSVADSRAVSVLRKAMLYDELQAKRPEIEAKAPPVQKVMPPGPAPARNAKATEAQRLKNRLTQTGAIEDAAALLVLES
ncbi:hypothetical protein [Azospirillum soli]|uniref:hypothetical protein n=1 Tax=Azospirillum soli TaxID=1304799 RepID=UPI001AE599A0|nr:hypothetical protein [Azospirillum soli]MBP2311890.1 hypothetical protein [Azospirillum soli]